MAILSNFQTVPLKKDLGISFQLQKSNNSNCKDSGIFFFFFFLALSALPLVLVSTACPKLPLQTPATNCRKWQQSFAGLTQLNVGSKHLP